MHAEIQERQRRLEEINSLRIQRALSGMTHSFCEVYLALPVLLHVNHPYLPGYIDDNVPCGVANYQPQLKMLFDSFHLAESIFNQSPQISPAISSVYSMGSTSSLGQSNESDLDIWVCVEPSLSKADIQRLKSKCEKIEAWASSIGVGTRLFIIEANRFRKNKSNSLDEEDCGSSLHILLLDEFYRTKTRLAGKPTLWNIIPAEYSVDAKRYDNYVLSLIEDGSIDPEQWIDFGPLTSLSAEEYFGASLWQLYKSIDSPYKSVLKALLVEAYSSQYPQTEMLAVEMKRCLFDEDQHYHLDAYYFMLTRVTHYLTSIQDSARLDLVRRCFYLKVKEKLSFPMGSTSWRRQVLQELVIDWGWEQQKIEKLDNIADWKIDEARESHEEQLEAMMLTYRHLISFGRINNLNSVISPQDISILTRRLYAIFEVLPGKITLLNPHSSADLSESSLTFIHVGEDRVNRPGWYLYNRKPTFQEIIGHQPIEHANYLSKLVAWCYFNGLLAKRTTLYIKSNGDCNLDKLQRFVNDISTYFSRQLPPLEKRALDNPCEIRQLAIIVNLDLDPTKQIVSIEDSGHIEPLSLDVLSYGDEQRCLVGSIDLLYRNSWNEVRTLRFTKETSVLDALKTILGKMHQGANMPESLEVFCYSHQFENAIKQRMKKVICECIALRLSTANNNLARFKPIHIAGITWGLFFEHLGVTAYQFDNAVDFYGAISNNKLQGTALNFSKGLDELPDVIYAFASEGIVQFFFELADPGFNAYILDEHNQVEIYRHCNGSIENMVQDVHRFYALSPGRPTTAYATNFNLPQFYKLVSVNNVIQVVPYFSQHEEEAPSSS